MLVILTIAGVVLALYNWISVGMLLPRAIFNGWWMIAQFLTFFLLGFFILKFIWPKSAGDAYNSLFHFCSAIVGVFVTIMAIK